MPVKVLTVTELNNFIKRLFDSNSILKHISVEGEISNMVRASSGHYYFSLKDLNSEIRCIMWRSVAEKLKFSPRDGLNVKVNGAVSVYAQKGSYSIILTSMQPAGVGTLYQILQNRIEELREKGYFNQELKKAIPTDIKKVGVVTSETGAVIHDIITTIKRRNPLIDIVLVPSSIQGENAVPEIVKGIEQLDKLDDIDVIIVGRGGGSIEDLWAFNELEVAEAIFKASKPIISSVGHETDTTISDLVADLRVPTPTAAAEMVSYGYTEIIYALNNLNSSMFNSVVNKYNYLANRVNNLSNLIKSLNPETQIVQMQFKVDELDFKVKNLMNRKVDSISTKLELLKQKITLLNPTSILKRGFTIVTDDNNKLIKNLTEAKEYKDLTINFYDGKLDVVVENNGK